MKKSIYIVNGPNLNLVGIREPEIYGKVEMKDFINDLIEEYKSTVEIAYYQSNCEGNLVDHLQEIGFDSDGIVFNPGALSHYSYSIADAIKSITTPVVEVHISNIYQRETFRQHSVTAQSSRAVLSGFGLHGYRMGIDYFI